MPFSNKVIHLNRNTKRGILWEVAGINYETLLEYLRNREQKEVTIKVKYEDVLYNLKVYYDNGKIRGYYSDCLSFKIYKKNEQFGSDLGFVTTDCDLVQKIRPMIQPSKYLLALMDATAIAFGIDRLYLVDSATPTKTLQSDAIDLIDAIEQPKTIDLTLYMIMKSGQTFYERYGYKFCDNDIQFVIQKDLLRFFNYKVFVYLLQNPQRLFVSRTLKELKKTHRDYKYVKDFYLDAYNYYDLQSDTTNILVLQDILEDSSQPWYSMVSLISSKKKCMLKVFA